MLTKDNQVWLATPVTDGWIGIEETSRMLGLTDNLDKMEIWVNHERWTGSRSEGGDLVEMLLEGEKAESIGQSARIWEPTEPTKLRTVREAQLIMKKWYRPIKQEQMWLKLKGGPWKGRKVEEGMHIRLEVRGPAGNQMVGDQAVHSQEPVSWYAVIERGIGLWADHTP
jgi:hypothetical protein